MDARKTCLWRESRIWVPATGSPRRGRRGAPLAGTSGLNAVSAVRVRVPRRTSNHAFFVLMEREAMPAAQSIETRGGVAYATHDGVLLLGDLYLPAGAGPFPALVAAHGGGWQAGARSAFQFWGPYLAARGYALF